jgi:hypothetical protein
MAYIENEQPEEGCVFCNRPLQPDGPENLIIARGQHAYVILNLFPYTSGHLMIVPFVHQPSLEMLDVATRAEMSITRKALTWEQILENLPARASPIMSTCMLCRVGGAIPIS